MTRAHEHGPEARPPAPQPGPAAAAALAVVGEAATRDDDRPWTVAIGGLVANPVAWPLDALAARPRRTLVTDIHCVTRWSKFDMRFGGLPLAELLDEAKPLPEARYVSFVARSERRHGTSLPLDVVRQSGAFVAFAANDAPLATEHGGPVLVVVPGRYFYKSVK